MAKNVLTSTLSEPLNRAKTAEIDIDAGDGNLTIDQLTGDEPLLVSGTLQYFENQGTPTCRRVSNNGQSTLKLRGGRSERPWFRFPWSACNGATDWMIHLNPAVAADITAHSDGGNLRLDLTGLAITDVLADTGGGNVDVILPDGAEDVDVVANTGAGNVTIEAGRSLAGANTIHAITGAGNATVRLPEGTAARIHITTGLGKAIVDPRFSQLDKNTYQSPGFENASHSVEITAKSGAGNVIIETR